MNNVYVKKEKSRFLSFFDNYDLRFSFFFSTFARELKYIQTFGLTKHNLIPNGRPRKNNQS